MSSKPGPNRFARDVFIVAGQELSDSIRTKRAILLIILMCGIMVAGTLMFIKLIKSVETQLVSALGLDAGPTGSATATLWKSDFFRHALSEMVGDKDVAQTLLQFTPLGLYFGWFAMMLAPWLVALTSSERIAEEIWSGSARFVLCRTTRLAWAFGKFIGQALQLLVALLLCIIASWLCGWFKFDSFEGARTFGDMLLFAPKAWILGLSYLGLVTGISMFCKSPGVARVLGIIGFISATGIYQLAKHFAGDGIWRILDGVQIILPQHHYFDLMRPDWAHALPATIFLIALGLGYLLIGYARLAKRDL
jgi:ABC-type transport system involved in multi-copper enzyme maturation permease subunit